MPEEIKRPDENLRMLHQALAADKVYQENIPSDYNEFVRLYSEPENAKNLHAALASDIDYQENIPQDFVEAMNLYGLGKPSAVPPSASGSAMPIVNSPMPTEQPEDIQSTQSSAPQYLSPEELGGVQMLPSETSPEQIRAEAEAVPVNNEEQLPAPTTQFLKPQVEKRVKAITDAENYFRDYLEDADAKAQAGEQSFGGAALDAYGRGSASLVAGVLRTPEFIYDMIAAPLGGEPFREAFPEDDWTKQAEYWEGVSRRSSKRNEAKYGKEITDYISEGDYSNAAQKISTAIIESVPVMLGIMAGQIEGVGASELAAGGGLVFGAQKKQELIKTNPDLSEAEMNMIALANGLTEGVFESAFGVGKLAQITKSAFGKLPKEEAAKVAKDSFVKAYGGVLRKYFGIATEEALSEAATQFTQNAIDKYAGVDPDKDLMEGVADAFIVGGAMGGAMSTPAAAADFAKTKKARTKVAEVAEKREQLRASLQDPNLPDAAKQAISDKIKDLNVEEAEAVQPDMDAYRALPEADKAKVDDLVTKTNKIEASLENPEIPEETKVVLEEKVKEYQDEIQGVLSKEEAPKETEPTEQPLEAEASTEQAPAEITSADFEQFDLRGKEGRQAREQLRTKYGAEAVSRMEDITKNFEQTISDLEKQGKIRKECP